LRDFLKDADHAVFQGRAGLALPVWLSINELAKSMVMDRTTLGRAIRPLQRDRLLTIGAGEDGRTRSLRLTATGEARLKAATAKWREAQKEFEMKFGARDAVELRGILERVVSVN
jgi:DNA-binding MarR family transcriptional regulator